MKNEGVEEDGWEKRSRRREMGLDFNRFQYERKLLDGGKIVGISTQSIISCCWFNRWREIHQNLFFFNQSFKNSGRKSATVNKDLAHPSG